MTLGTSCTAGTAGERKLTERRSYLVSLSFQKLVEKDKTGPHGKGARSCKRVPGAFTCRLLAIYSASCSCLKRGVDIQRSTGV